MEDIFTTEYNVKKLNKYIKPNEMALPTSHITTSVFHILTTRFTHFTLFNSNYLFLSTIWAYFTENHIVCGCCPTNHSTYISMIGFGKISVIGYRLNLTDMPSLHII